MISSWYRLFREEVRLASWSFRDTIERNTCTKLVEGKGKVEEEKWRKGKRQQQKREKEKRRRRNGEKELVRAMLIMFREFNTLELTFL